MGSAVSSHSLPRWASRWRATIYFLWIAAAFAPPPGDYAHSAVAFAMRPWAGCLSDGQVFKILKLSSAKNFPAVVSDL